VNAWIRTHDKRLGDPEPSFDAVIDLEDVVKDPTRPRWALVPDLTCDGVHPNQAGYTAIANAIPLDVFDSESTPLGSGDAGFGDAGSADAGSAAAADASDGG
jgi:hypothetical protein